MSGRFLSVSMLFFLLGACGFSPDSTFYVLDDSPLPTRSFTLDNADTVIIGVEDISIPTYLDRPQIVIREKEDDTLEMAEFHRCSKNPDFFSTVTPGQFPTYW